jgi:beta-phosphoglucomutase-like phosphatase (HAD superfamily)
MWLERIIANDARDPRPLSHVLEPLFSTWTGHWSIRSIYMRAWEDTFREFGKEIPFEEIRRQIGKGPDQPIAVTRRNRKGMEKRSPSGAGKIFKEKYLRAVKGFPGVRDLFQRVLADGKKIALASSAVGEELET